MTSVGGSNPTTGAGDPAIAALTQALQAALQAQRSSTASASAQAPTKPNLGGLLPFGTDPAVPWVGGKPKSDWSGLDASVTSPLHPGQYRATSLGGSQKTHAYRTRGLEAKFKRNDNLRNFENRVWTHLVTNGLDTMSYLPDPITNGAVATVVLDHTRYNVEVAFRERGKVEMLYDEYDKANDGEAVLFLYDSLDDELVGDLRLQSKETDTFAILWMRLIKIIRGISIERFNTLTKEIENMKPSQFARQNIREMTNSILLKAKELKNAGQYRHTTTLHIVNNLIAAGTGEHESLMFRYPLAAVHAELTKALITIGHMDRASADAHMANNGLTFDVILEDAATKYESLIDTGTWGPASHAKDSKAAPVNFGNLAKMPNWINSDVVAQAFAVVQSIHNGSNRDKSGDKCNKCGQLGHWARECPKSKGGHNNSRTNKHHGSKDPNKERNWKKVPPKDGKNEKKEVNGHTWMWCKICRRWTSHHGTAGHVKKGEQPSANLLYTDSDAWHYNLELELMPAFWTQVRVIVALFGSMLLPLLGATLIGGLIVGKRPQVEFLSFMMSNKELLWSFGPWLVVMLMIFGLSVQAHVNCTRLLTAMTLPKPPLARWKRRRQDKWNRRQHRHCRNKARDLFLSVQRPKILTNHYHHHRRGTLPSMPSDPMREELRKFANSIQFCRVVPKGREGEKPAKRAYGKKRKCKKPSNRPMEQPFIFHATPGPVLGIINAFRATITGEQRGKKVIFDSGATLSVSPDRNDFVGPIKRASFGRKLQGISKGLEIKGEGHVAWTFTDTTGMLRTLKVPALWVPEAQVRLLSTSSLLQTYPREKIVMENGKLRLSGYSNDPNATKPVEILIEPSTNLPVGEAIDPNDYGVKESNEPSAMSAMTTVSESNFNLSSSEKELLRWHQRLGHLAFRKIQFLMRSGVLAHSESIRRLQAAAAKLTLSPLCAACQFGKQKRNAQPGKRSSVVKDREGVLKEEILFPGQKVSVDHFVCSTRGRLPNTFGKEDDTKKFSGGCIFVDHATGYIFTAMQTHLNTHETLKAKEAFERHCRDFGVVIQTYLSDNGSSFSSKEYQTKMEQFQQIQRFAGVGAHHHNGIAERGIQTVMSVARTMMLHAAIHWNDVADPQLWPMAVKHATYLYNHMPNPATGLSPHDLLSKTRWPHAKFQDCHVWGCPVYVLDKKMADGRKLPRWKPRAQRHVYIGQSDRYSSTVPLILNLETGAITPQFHVVFDDWFSTVPGDPDKLPTLDTPQWNELFGDATHHYVEDGTEEDPTTEGSVPEAIDLTQPHPPTTLGQPAPALDLPTDSRVQAATEIYAPVRPLETEPATSVPAPLAQQRKMPPVLPVSPAPSAFVEQRESFSTPPTIESPVVQQPSPQREQTSKKVKQTSTVELPPLRRSTRNRRTPNRYANVIKIDREIFHNEAIERAMGYYSPSPMLSEGRYGFSVTMPTTWTNGAHTGNPVAFATRANKDRDTFSFAEAMKSSDREKWIEAAVKEISQLIEKGTWEEVPTSVATKKILPGTWTFRRKRNPSGEITKHKGRYCVRGDLEESDEEHSSPVCSFASVRLFLILTLVLKWKSCSIDFANAFVQSKMPDDKPMWIHLPRGFKSTKGLGYCLRLKKSLYGTSIAPLLWYQSAVKVFTDIGFHQSKYDCCVLLRRDAIVVLYVDDAGIAAAEESTIDKIVSDIREKGFELTKEGSFSEFLGIKITKLENGALELTQKGLIDKILEATGMTDCRPNWLPASSTALGPDPDGEPMNEDWSYPSIVGMLLYLSSNTRPDIQYAVSQVCRYSATPKQSHATAVKMIVRYLKRTCDKGTIINPRSDLNLDLYVDADFAGLYGAVEDSNPDSVKSRSGYTIMLAGCHLLSKSVLQTSIACSTLEAEYSALSFALKTLLPVKRLLREIVKALDLEASSMDTSIRARVFEDNQGAYYLATKQRLTNRTKYFLVGFHWFWSFYPEEFDIIKCASRDQLADYFTKGLTRELFENNRRGVQGW